MWKPSSIFIAVLLVADSFFVAYAVGFNSRHVLVVDPKLAIHTHVPAATNTNTSVSSSAGGPNTVPAQIATAENKTFTDLSAIQARLKPSLTKAADAGILDATDDMKFHPNDPVTRADFTRWMVRIRQIPTVCPPTNTYFDVDSSNPYYKDIEGATEAMMVQGYVVKNHSQKAFKPEQFITRQEFAVMYGTFSGKRGRAEKLSKKEVEKYLRYNPSVSSFNYDISYRDVGDVDDWARKWIAVAHQAGVLQECFDVDPYDAVDEKRYLHPHQKMTRAEAVNILVKLYGLQSKNAVDEKADAS